MAIVLVGLNHTTAPVELREQFYLAGDRLRPALTRLGACCLDEVAILSTCNRLEMVGVTGDARQGIDHIRSFLAEMGVSVGGTLPAHLITLEGERAAEHLMRVAAGLESAILGETQILGQVAGALKAAQEAGTSGAILSRLFAAALRVGKRARAETGISRHTLSISHAAVALVRRDLPEDARVLVIGAGQMAALAVRALRQNPAVAVRIINRTYHSAYTLAATTGAEALPWDCLPEALREADAVIAATATPSPVLRADHAPLLAGHPVLLVDLGLPRNVAPELGTQPGVTLYDIDALHRVVAGNQAQRQSEVAQVEAIIADEQAAFRDWLNARRAVPVIVALREQGQAVAEAEIQAALRRMPDLTPREQDIIARMGRRIVNQLLHAPTVALKERAAQGGHYDYRHAVRQLFALDDGDDASHG